MFRRVGVLNAPQSASFFVCVKRPRSTMRPRTSADTEIVELVIGKERIILADGVADLAIALLRIHEQFQSPLSRGGQRFLVMSIIKRSNGEFPLSTVRSNEAMDLTTRSMVTWSVPQACLNNATYFGSACRRCTTSAWVVAISTGFSIGPLACSSRLGARPSQNCREL